MTEKEIRQILGEYYDDDQYLDSEIDYVTKPTYRDFGLAVKESYEEYVSSVNYDE